MKNDDYKVEFENNRKEIELDQNEDASLPSRTERHGRRRKQKKTSSHTMINVILGVFTFIPILIFVYVLYNFYFGSDNGSAKVDNSVVTVDVGTNTNAPSGNSENPDAVPTDSEKEKEDDKTTDGKAEQEEKENKEVVNKKPAVNVNPPATEKKETPSEKVDAKVDEKVDKKPVVESGSKTHVVAANETLYRISMNYYGSDSGIEKIKKANGLSSNDIMVGQKLIIP